LCITLIDESNRTATELVEESHPIRPEDGQRLIASLERRLGDATVLVLSGSLVRGVSSDFYARCVTTARRAKVKTILDASGDALRLGIDARPDFVKINANEFREAFSISESSDLDESILKIAGEKQTRLIVTDGSKRVLASDGSKLFSITPPTVEVVSAIGSGDSFAGGLAVGIERGESFECALALGVACAADNARSPHAGFVDANRVTQLLGAIRVL